METKQKERTRDEMVREQNAYTRGFNHGEERGKYEESQQQRIDNIFKMLYDINNLAYDYTDLHLKGFPVSNDFILMRAKIVEAIRIMEKRYPYRQKTVAFTGTPKKKEG